MACDLYPYTPSMAMAAIAVVLFSGLTAVHSFRMITTRTWDSIFFVLGGLCELGGFASRLVSSEDVCNVAAYRAQSVLLLLGPSLFMFSVNLTQTEFARALDAGRFCWLPFPAQRWGYLGVNSALLVAQAMGGILTVTATEVSTIAAATKLTVAIYVIQMVFWLFTLAENIAMTFRLGRHPTEASKTVTFNWKLYKNLFGLAVSIIATGRNLMRMTMAGNVAFLVDNEWALYAFDGFQMVVVLGAWTIFYLPEKCTFKASPNGRQSYVRLERTRQQRQERTFYENDMA
ncbi:hypothetical protein ASPZODRAFT_96297 [Penicilliopsis zonata CBS 506.65]|uniref:RTA1 domain protein n=1 Tax=Penicilliopsis zonata CBS 506.65 TaxID=1073090 RepID=A0A1L9SJS0_9EURO|nr:hypothetical protein ASPZODRAFT_96297 [Penicilliopsis zonata CBS 506.65]OJJ47343.1 hypothetical protein ASPZODRAFT_96297 [Penicilliopsis zonata CBS 506.65]